MNLLNLYTLQQKGEMTIEDMATALDMTTRNLKIRMTKHGAKLPLLLACLDKIRSDQMTRTNAASTLGVTVRTINQLMVSWNVIRPIKEYLFDRTVSEVKWEVRKKYAIDYIGEHLTIEGAAVSAKVSTRQIRRWVLALVKKHYGIVFRDLSKLTLKERRRMAEVIEQKEGLGYAAQERVKAVAEGSKPLQDEALERVTVRREWRKRSK